MVRADKRRYHYIYKTICLITQKYYIGMHSTDNLDDGYLGSGTVLSRSIKKYGKDAHRCEILEFLPDRETLKLRERSVVTEEIVSDPMCLNLKQGGHGGWDHINNGDFEKSTEASREKIKQLHNDPSWLSKKRDKNSAAMQKRMADGYSPPKTFSDPVIREKAIILAKSESSLAKRRETYSTIKHQQGSSNSQFGTCWISNKDRTQELKISVDQLNSYLNDGWSRGRKIKKI